MPFEAFIIGYKLLFKVEVQHRYFRNFGIRDFEQPVLPGDTPSEQVFFTKTVQLLEKQYEVSRFWRIEPDTVTRAILRNQHMVFKNLPDGFCVGIETKGTVPVIPLPDDLHLVFEVRLNDPDFLTYTDLDKSVCDDLMKNAKVFRFTNAGTGSQDLNSNETIAISDLVTYAPPAGMLQKRPLGYLDLQHVPPTASLLNGVNVPVGQVFKILLANRTTRWTSGGTDVPGNPHPLVANGLVAVSLSGKKLPNPTPATTTYQTNEFVSIIY